MATTAMAMAMATMKDTLGLNTQEPIKSKSAKKKAKAKTVRGDKTPITLITPITPITPIIITLEHTPTPTPTSINIKKISDLDVTTKISMIGKMLVQHNTQYAITIINNLIKQNIDMHQIIYIIEELLSFGDIEFLRFVNSFNSGIINMFTNLDKILYKMDTDTILTLLYDKIIDIELSAKLNKVSLANVMYIIIQFSDYNKDIKQYLFDLYVSQCVINFNKNQKTNTPHTPHTPNTPNTLINTATNKQVDSIEETKNINKLKYKLIRDLDAQLLIHMVHYNICNDIFVYVKACVDSNMLSPEILNFDRILEAYQTMENTYKDEVNNKCLRSRLVGVIKLISKYCLDKLANIPIFTEYKQHFNTYYNIQIMSRLNIENKNTQQSQQLSKQLDLICIDSYKYINSQLSWGSQYDLDF